MSGQDPVTVVCWLWTPPAGYRSQFRPEHANTLQRMVARHLTVPHRFVCVTDQPDNPEFKCETFKLWGDYMDLRSPWGINQPSCYKRLRTFSADAGGLAHPGQYILSCDLDAVICGNIDHLVQRTEDIVLWGDVAKNTPYNGGLWLLKVGTRTPVWTKFDPNRSPAITKSKRLVGSDQAWMGHMLGPFEKKFSFKDGVYSFRNHFRLGRLKLLPENARLIMFHGHHDPWDADVRAKWPWIVENYH